MIAPVGLMQELEPRAGAYVHPEMNASFFIAGPGIRRGSRLGVVDMRRIAPTLAQLLRVPFPSADLPPLASIFDEPKPRG